MNNFVIMFSFANNPAPECPNDAMKYVESFQYSTKLFDNAYQVFTFQDLPEIFNAISQKLSPDDKMIITQATLFKGKNTPNI